MRFYEISSGFRIPVSQEEQDVLDIISNKKGKVDKSVFDERQNEVARKMVTRGLLSRKRDGNGNIVLSAKNVDDIWRY